MSPPTEWVFITRPQSISLVPGEPVKNITDFITELFCYIPFVDFSGISVSAFLKVKVYFLSM